MYVNPGMAKLPGVETGAISERPIWSFIAPDEVPRLLELHGRRVRGEVIPNRFETVVATADGTRLPVEIVTARVQLDGREANVTFVLDTTARKQAQDATQRSDNTFRALAENAPDGIVILRWPIVAYANQRAAELLGFGPGQEAVGTNISERLVPADADRAEQRIVQRLRGDRMSTTAEYGVRGSSRIVEVSATPIQYEGGPFTTKPIGVGTGLELPICLGIVRVADGKLDLESEPGDGTTVTVMLPGHFAPTKP